MNQNMMQHETSMNQSQHHMGEDQDLQKLIGQFQDNTSMSGIGMTTKLHQGEATGLKLSPNMKDMSGTNMTQFRMLVQ